MKRKTMYFILHTSYFLLQPFSRNIAVAADLPEIVRRGSLIVAVKDNVRPLGFRDAKGNLQGLEIDIARHLAEEILGRSDAVVLQPVANQERLAVVLEHKVDLTIARVTATTARSRLVDFSAAYYIDGTGFVTKDATVQRNGDLTNRKIAVLNNSSTIAQVRFALPSAQLVGVDSYQDALKLLEAGDIAAFAADGSVLSGWVQEYPQYRILPSLLSAEALCVVMPRGLQYESLRQRVNLALSRWRASGWLKQRATYWGLLNP